MKTYMIVTNDEYETPVKMDLVGTKAVAEYLGLSLTRVQHNLSSGSWGHIAKIKAVEDESVIVDVAKRNKEYGRRWRMTHDRSEYNRQYYQKKKGEKNETTQEANEERENISL